MRYFAAYRFLFENPNWPLHLLVGFISQFVPIVGLMVLMGYLFEVIEAKHSQGPEQYPVFDFSRLGAYLTRGVWPMLVSLVASIPILLLGIPLFMSFMFFGVAASQSRNLGPFMILLIGICVLVLIVSTFVVQILSAPLILRAGLSQDFGSAFSMPYWKDFLGRVGKELVLSVLFMIVTTPFVALLGFLALCIGIYAATVVIIFAHYNLYYQLYELYLSRGGTPIPLKAQ